MPEEKAKAAMSCREAGIKGGTIVRERYGKEFYQAIGRKGGVATKKSHGPEYYQEIGRSGGRKGGEATRDRHGKSFYETIGQKGGQKVRALIELGKEKLASDTAASPVDPRKDVA